MKEEPVDQGFKLIYWRLSQRRKLIRTLWFIPIFGLFFFPGVRNEIVFGMPTWFLGILGVVWSIVQAAYHYTKWKRERTAGS